MPSTGLDSGAWTQVPVFALFSFLLRNPLRQASGSLIFQKASVKVWAASFFLPSLGFFRAKPAGGRSSLFLAFHPPDSHTAFCHFQINKINNKLGNCKLISSTWKSLAIILYSFYTEFALFYFKLSG